MRYLIWLAVISFFFASSAVAQMSTDSVSKGKVWGLGFGDIAFKYDRDESNRGATNQYTGMAENQSIFQFRRVYLGYDYVISKKFSSNFLLAMEENFVNSASTTPTITGDLLSNGRYSMFIKNANVNWNNIFEGSTLSLGMLHTPAAVLLSEVVWDYRCIERTISELRRTPAWDMGVMLHGTLLNKEKTEIGYHLMIGNGSGSRPENDAFKWYYGDVYVKLFKKRLILDGYADFNRTSLTAGNRRERHMFKGLLAWSTPKFTIGVEAFSAVLRNEVDVDETSDSLVDVRALNYSVYARGRIYKEKLGYFIRYDGYNPTGNRSEAWTEYKPLTPQYNPNYSEVFFTFGLDYTPIDHIHIMPNIWFTEYRNAGGDSKPGQDAVIRLSVYYVYGK